MDERKMLVIGTRLLGLSILFRALQSFVFTGGLFPGSTMEKNNLSEFQQFLYVAPHLMGMILGLLIIKKADWVIVLFLGNDQTVNASEVLHSEPQPLDESQWLTIGITLIGVFTMAGSSRHLGNLALIAFHSGNSQQPIPGITRVWQTLIPLILQVGIGYLLFANAKAIASFAGRRSTKPV